MPWCLTLRLFFLIVLKFICLCAWPSLTGPAADAGSVGQPERSPGARSRLGWAALGWVRCPGAGGARSPLGQGEPRQQEQGPCSELSRAALREGRASASPSQGLPMPCLPLCQQRLERVSAEQPLVGWHRALLCHRLQYLQERRNGWSELGPGQRRGCWGSSSSSWGPWGQECSCSYRITE